MKIVVENQDSPSRAPRSKKDKRAGQKKQEKTSRKASGKGFRRTSKAPTAAEVEAQARERERLERQEAREAAPLSPYDELGGEQAVFTPPGKDVGEPEEESVALTTPGVGVEDWPPTNPEQQVGLYENSDAPEQEEHTEPEEEEPAGPEEEEPVVFAEDAEEGPRPRRGLDLSSKKKAKAQRGKRDTAKAKPKKGKAKKEQYVDYLDDGNYDSGTGDWDDGFAESLAVKQKPSTLSSVLGIVETMIAMAIFAVLGTQVGTLLLNNLVTRA